ncbi:hypothetical protein A225_1121 [Klebsiella michiganensis E718]|nr:hypothetical protein A225_1121 [Klebsiella michiganensis E718]
MVLWRPRGTPVCYEIELGRSMCLHSSEHRLLGEDTRHRALPCCRSDRGHSRVGEVASGVDAWLAGFAALIGLEYEAGWRINRGETQGLMQTCGWPGTGMCEEDIDRDSGAVIESDGGLMAFITENFHDLAFNDGFVSADEVGLDFGCDVVTIGKDRQPVGPVMEEPDLIVRLRARPDEAPMLVGDFKAVAVGARYDGRPPAFSKARNIRHLVSDAIAQDQAARPQAFVIVSDDAEIVDSAGYAFGSRIDQPDRWIALQLLASLDQDVQRRLVVVAEHTMRIAGKAIAWPISVEDRDFATGASKLQGGGKAGKAAADDDNVIHGDGLRVLDAGRWLGVARLAYL